MKVSELIEMLEDLDPELDVILQMDAEGNGYSPCAGADLTMYRPEYNETLSPEDYPDDAEEVVVIWPV